MCAQGAWPTRTRMKIYWPLLEKPLRQGLQRSVTLKAYNSLSKLSWNCLMKGLSEVGFTWSRIRP